MGGLDCGEATHDDLGAAASSRAPTFTATLQREWLAAADDVVAAIGKSGKKIVDARTVAEMDGTDTRLSSRGGVIPSAVPVYWEDLLDPSAKTFKPADELLAIYARHGLTPGDEVIAYCWVGHRSAVDSIRASPGRLRTAAQLSGVVGGVEPPDGAADGSAPSVAMAIPIRDAREEDLPAVLEIYNE